MNRGPAPFSVTACRSATSMAALRVDRMVKDAMKLTEDPDRERRVAASKCVWCHYIPRIGGAAMTSQPCACCKKDQMHASTATSALCKDCAASHDLCVQCGGDINLNVNRKNWEGIPK